jgi:LPXTG-motif cell wall-anchored protein
VVTDPTETPTVPPTTANGGDETTPPTISQIPGTNTKPTQPGATPGAPEPAMQLWYILVPAAAILLLAVLFLVKKRKK